MKKIANYFIINLLLLPLLTNGQTKPTLKTGIWRAVLQTSGGELPFGLDIKPASQPGHYTVFALNGAERLAMDEATIQNDSLRIPMSLFESELVGKLDGDHLTGVWRKRRTNLTYQIVPFSAHFGQTFRFKVSGEAPTANLSGKWQTLFREKRVDGTSGDTTLAVGIFEQKGPAVTGTFLTPTGDYRYLAGDVAGDSLFLSCFDGNHAFLFKARMGTLTSGSAKTLTGVFHSGPVYRETWTAQLNTSAALPDPAKLTFVKPGQTFTFAFPDATGKTVSLNDPQFKGKVTVIQIMGSWCPNCMDETKFMAPWYAKNKGRGVAVVGLAFEKTASMAESGPKLQRMIDRFTIQYPVLLAGTNNKAEASKVLPALSRVAAFPTTIFVDKKGTVRHIHTGFSGPGTGVYYDQYVSDFNRLIDKLLAEK